MKNLLINKMIVNDNLTEEQERRTQRDVAVIKSHGYKDIGKNESLSHFILRHEEALTWVH